MPFVSTKQRKFMYAKHPGIARRWTAEAKEAGVSSVQKSLYLDARLAREIEVSKVRFRAPIRRVTDTRAKLGPNEFWHATNKEGAEGIKREGFRLANPRSTQHRGIDAMARGDESYSPRQKAAFRGDGKKTRTRTGRPIATGDMGPGVYMTKDPKLAHQYGEQLGSRNPRRSKMRRGTHSGEVLRVKVKEGPTHSYDLHHGFLGARAGAGQEVLNSPQATKRGINRVERTHHTDAGKIHEAVVANPKHVTVVDTPKRWAPGWTPGEYTAAAGGTALGGAGYADYRAGKKRKQRMGQPLSSTGKS